MRRNLTTLAALMLLPAVDATAMSVDDTVPSVTLLVVDDTDDLDVVRRQLGERLDAGRRLVVHGRHDLLARLRPDVANAWPVANTILLDPGAGLGIHGFDATSIDAARSIAMQWHWNDDGARTTPVRLTRETPAEHRALHFNFGLAAASPALLCQNFVHELGVALFGTADPSDAGRRALRMEARRWCQYGMWPTHVAELPQFTIASSWIRNYGQLSLATEWALIRNEDGARSSRTSYLFWVKTLGEGEHYGFTREPGRDGGITGHGQLHDMLDAAIHSGWGPLQRRGAAGAWPVESSFPYTENVQAFRCETHEATRPVGCPSMPILRKLYPEDSSDGFVSVSSGEGLEVEGDATVSRGANDAYAISLDITVTRRSLPPTSVKMPFVRTQSNADTTFFRSTRWTPDFPGLYRWATGSEHVGSLAAFTPIAGSLNPRYDVMWEIPLDLNMSRDLPYHMVYDLGWNACASRAACLEREAGGTIRRQVKTRMGWSDDLILHLSGQ